jgi:hypothetical protein
MWARVGKWVLFECFVFFFLLYYFQVPCEAFDFFLFFGLAHLKACFVFFVQFQFTHKPFFVCFASAPPPPPPPPPQRMILLSFLLFPSFF